jgi:hypothetical protein
VLQRGSVLSLHCPPLRDPLHGAASLGSHRSHPGARRFSRRRADARRIGLALPAVLFACFTLKRNRNSAAEALARRTPHDRRQGAGISRLRPGLPYYVGYRTDGSDYLAVSFPTGAAQEPMREGAHHAYRCGIFGEGRRISTTGGNSHNRSAQDLISGPGARLPRTRRTKATTPELLRR